MSQLDAFGEISKIDEDRRQVFGWCYVTHDAKGEVVVDKSGEFIEDYDELEKAAYKFVLESRQGTDRHERNDVGAIKKSSMIESMVMTPEKTRAMGIPDGTVPTGWWVGFAVEDDALWQEIKKGNRPAFSIHGKGIRKNVKK